MEKVHVFLKKYPKLNDTQKNIASSMILSGGTEKVVIEAIQGYKSGSSKPNSMSCPRCSSTMLSIMLADGRKARYCAKDRITLPFKVET